MQCSQLKIFGIIGSLLILFPISFHLLILGYEIGKPILGTKGTIGGSVCYKDIEFEKDWIYIVSAIVVCFMGLIIFLKSCVSGCRGREKTDLNAPLRKSKMSKYEKCRCNCGKLISFLWVFGLILFSLGGICLIMIDDIPLKKPIVVAGKTECWQLYKWTDDEEMLLLGGIAGGYLGLLFIVLGATYSCTFKKVINKDYLYEDLEKGDDEDAVKKYQKKYNKHKHNSDDEYLSSGSDN